MSALEPLLTEADAAKIFNLPTATLRNWRSRGDGPPFVKIGAVVRYRQSDLRDFLEAQTRNTPSYSRTRGKRATDWIKGIASGGLKAGAEIAKPLLMSWLRQHLGLP